MDTRDEEAIPVLADEQQQEQQSLLQAQPVPQPQEQETDQGPEVEQIPEQQPQEQQENQEQNQGEELLDEPSELERLEYIKKILNILIAQLSFYLFLSFLVCSNQGYILMFQEYPKINLFTFCFTLIFLIVGYYLSDHHRTGWVLLCIYTFFHALILTNFCTQLMVNEDLDMNVITATLLLQFLLILVISVRVYTYFEKQQFQLSVGFAITLLPTPIMIIFYQFKFQIETIDFLFILYVPISLFLVIELFYIKNGDRIALHIDNPIRGALILHIDFMLGFLILLALIVCWKSIAKCYKVQIEEENRRRRRGRGRGGRMIFEDQ